MDINEITIENLFVSQCNDEIDLSNFNVTNKIEIENKDSLQPLKVKLPKEVQTLNLIGNIDILNNNEVTIEKHGISNTNNNCSSSPSETPPNSE